ncbi:MAG: LPS export ABC transporter permease LptG [Gammaproteobacteria bacterium]|nr:LPS export ABC transporter permease LptG [Gammaproteobacteria bacterium]
MKIIQHYVTINLLWTTMLALAVLVALFSFFSLIDQLEDAGRGNYGVLQAATYVLLTMPRLAYELFPIAAVIGSMSTLGIMAQNRELEVIRTSGVSRIQLTVVMAKAGGVMVALALVVGELVAPVSEEHAQQLRTIALTQQITLKTKYGFWARSGNSYVNIRKVLPGNQVEQIYIYEFDNEDRLRSSTRALRATYENRQWRLNGIEQTVIDRDSVTRRKMRQAAWVSLLHPEMINLVIVQPQYLPIWGLSRYIGFLRQSAQNSRVYEQALWIKLVRPVTIIAMVLLAVPLVRGHSRYTAIGQRVFVGALIGVGFHIVNEASGHIGVVYELSPALSAAVPTLALLAMLVWMLRRSP